MNFTIYSKDGCPYCSQIEKVIKLSKFQYEVKKLNVDFNREEFYSKFGDGSTFPQVILDGKQLGGCAETVKYLTENKLV
jgi:glutaredoxin 3